MTLDFAKNFSITTQIKPWKKKSINWLQNENFFYFTTAGLQHGAGLKFDDSKGKRICFKVYDNVYEFLFLRIKYHNFLLTLIITTYRLSKTKSRLKTIKKIFKGPVSSKWLKK